jgi:ATP-dependent RNA helicase DDX46/PRP5
VPHRRRERSRDSYRDYRDRDRRYGRDRADEYRAPGRDRERDRGRDKDRDHHDGPRRGSRSSASATPGADAKRTKVDDRVARDDKPKRDHDDAVQHREAEKDHKDKEKEDKLARLAKWKAAQLAKKAKAETEAKTTQPDVSTPDVVMTDAASSSPQAAAKPAQEAPVAQPEPQPAQEVEAAKANVQVRLGNFKSLQADKKASAKDANPLSAFAADDAKLNTLGKRNLLQDDDAGTKRKLVKLDDVQDTEAEKMDSTEDVDPLDAFMEHLDTAAPTNGSAPQRGEALFGEDAEPDFLQPVGDDLFSIVAKKKKKDVPVIDHSKVAYEPFRKAFYTEPRE